MSDALSVRPSDDFSDLRLELTVNGHVVSPWFSFDCGDKADTPYQIGSRYHAIRAMAVAAFAHALNIQERDVIVTEQKDLSTPTIELRWRLGTARPMELPKAKQIKKPADPLAIDI